jgi:hypothetical protein
VKWGRASRREEDGNGGDCAGGKVGRVGGFGDENWKSCAAVNSFLTYDLVSSLVSLIITEFLLAPFLFFMCFFHHGNEKH